MEKQKKVRIRNLGLQNKAQQDLEKACSLSYPGFLLPPDCLLERWIMVNNPSGQLELILSTCQVLPNYITYTHRKGRKSFILTAPMRLPLQQKSVYQFYIHIYRESQNHLGWKRLSTSNWQIPKWNSSFILPRNNTHNPRLHFSLSVNPWISFYNLSRHVLHVSILRNVTVPPKCWGLHSASSHLSSISLEWRIRPSTSLFIYGWVTITTSVHIDIWSAFNTYTHFLSSKRFVVFGFF